jgi:cell division protein FtsW
MATTTTTQPTSEAQEAIAPLRPAGFDFDVYLLLIVIGLLAVGLMMVYSTTFDWSFLEYGSPVRIWLTQLRSAAIGVVVMLVMWRIDYRILRDRRIATAIVLITIVALVALLALNRNSEFGAQRSLYQGSYQPGEAAKLALIIYFGAWLASRRDQLHKIGYGLIPFSLLVGVMGGLIVLEPDLSTAAVLVLTAWTMFFVAGANIVQIVILAVGALGAGAVLAWQFDYARQRLIDHVSAMQDLTQASWHVQQAIIAFTAPGSRAGGAFSPNWLGVGLGESRQKFGFLPAPHTDSIFAIIGEELGLFGCLVVVALFVLFAWRAFKIARKADKAGEPFGAFVAVGIGAWIIYEAMLNISVVTAVIPFTGVALPFISYGGSNLVVVLAAVGLLMSISKNRPRRMDRARIKTVFDYGPQERRNTVSRVGPRPPG